MAEGLLRARLTEAGIEAVHVSSAGTMAPVGMPPPSDAQMVMSEMRIDISHHRARALTNRVAEEANMILVMEEAHRRFIEKRIPQALPKVHLIKVFGRDEAERDEDAEVADPIGRDLEIYRHCRDELDVEVKRVLPYILEITEQIGTSHDS
jgi:protein-tyrosine phosphatase